MTAAIDPHYDLSHPRREIRLISLQHTGCAFGSFVPFIAFAHLTASWSFQARGFASVELSSACSADPFPWFLTARIGFPFPSKELRRFNWNRVPGLLLAISRRMERCSTWHTPHPFS